MKRNFRLIIEYDGACFHGWQIQKNLRTVQGEITRALGSLTGQAVSVIGSGRTDAGVHAMAQVASFTCDTRLDPGTIQKALNSILARDIVIHDCREVPLNFHARYSAKSKTYRYRILNRDLPAALYRGYAWHIRKPLDLEAMTAALSHILGRHDFSSFEGAGSPKASSERHVMAAAFNTAADGYLAFEITADGFLKHMVRNIVGTLVEVGLGKKTPAAVADILAAKDRSRAGATAPGHGLFLVCVNYEPSPEP